VTALVALPGETREEAIRRIVAAAPPLTAEQRDRIRRILAPACQPPMTALRKAA
jgi:hypothetical protein